VTDGASLNEFCQQVVEHLRAIMVLQMTGDATLLDDQPKETVAQLQAQARQVDLGAIVFAVKRFSAAVPELKGGYQPQLPLELAFIEATQGAPVVQQVIAAPAQAPTASPAKSPKSATEATPAPRDGAISAGHADVEPAKLDADAARRLWARWKEFVAVVKTQCGQQAAAALQAVRDIAVGEQTVALAFGNNEFSRSLVAKPENLACVTDALSHFVGRSVILECQMGEKASVAGRLVAVTETPSSGPDPLLEFAVSDLGAQVVK
jgi:DNA polymerase-3 subunit gamma/tau